MQVPLKSGHHILLDEDSLPLLVDKTVYLGKNGYVHVEWGGRKNKSRTYIHRLVMQAKPGQLVDHVNGDKLDNRHANLRFCSHTENARNGKAHSDNGYSRYKGVSLHKKSGAWVAQSSLHGKHIHLGRFTSEEAAARAYDRFAEEHFGEFARTNLVST